MSVINRMVREENAAWNSHDVEKIAEFYTEDCIKEDIAVGIATHGKEEMKTIIRDAFAAMPDMHIELKSCVSTDDWAVTEWTMQGTYSGQHPGMPPATGKNFSVRGGTVMELRGGKIRRARITGISSRFSNRPAWFPRIPGPRHADTRGEYLPRTLPERGIPNCIPKGSFFQKLHVLRPTLRQPVNRTAGPGPQAMDGHRRSTAISQLQRHHDRY
jgi:steroid delta-isomerase-like uncharacterized protein